MAEKTGFARKHSFKIELASAMNLSFLAGMLWHDSQYRVMTKFTRANMVAARMSLAYLVSLFSLKMHPLAVLPYVVVYVFAGGYFSELPGKTSRQMSPLLVHSTWHRCLLFLPFPLLATQLGFVRMFFAQRSHELPVC